MAAKKIGHISTGVQDLIINSGLLTVTCVSTLHTEGTAAFPLPKWVHERATQYYVVHTSSCLKLHDILQYLQRSGEFL